jgi:hypothetical protein
VNYCECHAAAIHEPGNMQQLHGRLYLITLLLAISFHRTQGHDEKKKEHDHHSHQGLGDFTDENAEISNPLRHADFIKHKEYVN